MNRAPNDIKAPDGFLLGGLRLVRADGTILFQRGFWQVPAEWVGERVLVHCTDGGAGDLEVAPPGHRLWEHNAIGKNYFAPRTSRPDAKPGLRNAARKAWSERHNAVPAPGGGGEAPTDSEIMEAYLKVGIEPGQLYGKARLLAVARLLCRMCRGTDVASDGLRVASRATPKRGRAPDWSPRIFWRRLTHHGRLHA